MMCMSWVNTWCPARALLWVLSSQSSCPSSAPSGHGRGKAELAERLLPLLHFQGAILGAHTALPELLRVAFLPAVDCITWLWFPPRDPSAHWPRKGQCIYCTSSVPAPNTMGIIHKYFLTKTFQHCGGAVGGFP